MNDLELLFLVLAVVYGGECACWSRRGAVGFRTWLGRRWQSVHPGVLLGNQHGGFVFAAPLPPLGLLLTGTQLPLSLSPDGVLGYIAPAVNPGGRPAQTGRWFPWDQINRIEISGKKLRVNGQTVVKVGSPTFALRLSQELRALARLPQSDRAQAIERLVFGSFDGQSIEQRWREFQPQINRVRSIGNLLFVCLFLAAPAVIWFFGLGWTWPGLLAGVAACTFTAAFRFRRVHARLFPEADDERFTHFLIVLLSPASTIRAHDLLTRPVLEAFHPLAIANVFLAADEFKRTAREILREIRHPAWPVCPSSDPEAMEAERYGRALLLRAVEKFLIQHGLEPNSLLPPPLPADPTCRSYCPRCETQFVVAEGICDDCGGLPLAPIPKLHGGA